MGRLSGEDRRDLLHGATVSKTRKVIFLRGWRQTKKRRISTVFWVKAAGFCGRQTCMEQVCFHFRFPPGSEPQPHFFIAGNNKSEVNGRIDSSEARASSQLATLCWGLFAYSLQPLS